jgi:hypothetical protein
MRHLDEDARAVAGVRLAAARAAMVEVHQDLQRVRHSWWDFALHVDDEAQAAGVVLELRVVKPLFRRRRCGGFGTDCEEHMHIVAGTLKAKLPNGDWKSHGKGQFFVVPPNVKFEVEALADVAYLCHYKR